MFILDLRHPNVLNDTPQAFTEMQIPGRLKLPKQRNTIQTVWFSNYVRRWTIKTLKSAQNQESRINFLTFHVFFAVNRINFQYTAQHCAWSSIKIKLYIYKKAKECFRVEENSVLCFFI